MSTIEQIIAPVADSFAEFDELLRRVTHSDQPFIGPITRTMLHSGGKRMRPLLTLLVGELTLSQTSAATQDIAQSRKRIMAAAVLIEMIHWSTLVHDDVIDEAYVRRGEWTPGALLRSKSAVLVGDYLFSKGLAYASRCESFGAIKHCTRAIELVVDGELMQMEHSRLMDTTHEIYTEVIRHKTAALLAAAAASAAAEAAPSDSAHTERMYRFGELLGLAFQIKDDLLDFGFDTDGATGKELCNDLREGKLTLPLIRAIEVAPRDMQRKARKHLRSASNDRRSIQWLRKFIVDSDAVEYTKAEMNRHHAQAIAIVDQHYTPSPVTHAMERYADYVLGRTK